MKRNKTKSVAATPAANNVKRNPQPVAEYTVEECEQIFDDARKFCKASKVPASDANIRQTIVDHHGEAVAATVFGETAPAPAAPKSKPAKPAPKAKAKTRKLALVLGYPVVAVARAFGKHGFMPAVAVTAIHTVEPKASVAAIKTFVQAGRHGLRGKPAPLSKKQLNDLVAAVA